MEEVRFGTEIKRDREREKERAWKNIAIITSGKMSAPRAHPAGFPTRALDSIRDDAVAEGFGSFFEIKRAVAPCQNRRVANR